MWPLVSAVVCQLMQTCAGPVHGASVLASAYVRQSCWLKGSCFLGVPITSDSFALPQDSLKSEGRNTVKIFPLALSVP